MSVSARCGQNQDVWSHYLSRKFDVLQVKKLGPFRYALSLFYSFHLWKSCLSFLGLFLSGVLCKSGVSSTLLGYRLGRASAEALFGHS